MDAESEDGFWLIDMRTLDPFWRPSRHTWTVSQRAAQHRAFVSCTAPLSPRVFRAVLKNKFIDPEELIEVIDADDHRLLSGIGKQGSEELELWREQML